MIKSFRHKGLEKFYLTGSTAGIQAAHAEKLRLQLFTLNQATNLQDIRSAGWGFHPLSGNLQGHYSLKVSANWRLTFTFNGEDVEIVDYQDYH